MDPTNIFDLPNTSLLFWEIVIFLILTVLLYLFVYRPIRDRVRRNEIRQRRQPDERTISQQITDYRIERLRRALCGAGASLHATSRGCSLCCGPS